MSKQQSIERAAQKTKAVLGQHVKELVAHTVAMAEYNGHGHAVGRQGRAGHVLPPSNAHLQSGARLPQNICDGYGGDDPPQNDYGTVGRG
jgi:hypothetical protein